MSNSEWLADRMLDLTYGEMCRLEKELFDELRMTEAVRPRKHALAAALHNWARRTIHQKHLRQQRNAEKLAEAKQ